MRLQNVFLLLLAFITFTACQDEAIEPTGPDADNLAAVNGFLGLRQRAASTANDSSSTGNDDIECFAINYPIEVIMPGQAPQTVNNDDELDDLVTPWFEDENNWFSDEFPTFVFPISVTLEDGSVLSIADDEELCDLFYECYGDWEDWDDWDDWDDDEECDEDEDDHDDDDDDD